MHEAEPIALSRLLFAFLPPLAVIALMARWRIGAGVALYAFARMLVQLTAVGYLLVFLFRGDHPFWVLAALAVMLAAAAAIALRHVAGGGAAAYGRLLAALAFGSTVSLLVLLVVLRPSPWYRADVLVPLAGMLFANAMNTVSLAAERFAAERGAGVAPREARRRALRAALIPIGNTLFAVGLVSLPGIMTGQILAGVSPLVAVRYQVLVLCLMFGASGLAAAAYLALAARRRA